MWNLKKIQLQVKTTKLSDSKLPWRIKFYTLLYITEVHFMAQDDEQTDDKHII